MTRSIGGTHDARAVYGALSDGHRCERCTKPVATKRAIERLLPVWSGSYILCASCARSLDADVSAAIEFENALVAQRRTA
jgi:hypothetical protein